MPPSRSPFGASPYPGPDFQAFSDWFVAKLYEVDGLTPAGYQFKEWHLDPDAALVLKEGGRLNGDDDLAYFVDTSSTWTINTPATDPPVLVRRGAGAGGAKWEIWGGCGGTWWDYYSDSGAHPSTFVYEDVDLFLNAVSDPDWYVYPGILYIPADFEGTITASLHVLVQATATATSPLPPAPGTTQGSFNIEMGIGETDTTLDDSDPPDAYETVRIVSGQAEFSTAGLVATRGDVFRGGVFDNGASMGDAGEWCGRNELSKRINNVGGVDYYLGMYWRIWGAVIPNSASVATFTADITLRRSTGGGSAGGTYMKAKRECHTDGNSTAGALATTITAAGSGTHTDTLGHTNARFQCWGGGGGGGGGDSGGGFGGGGGGGGEYAEYTWTGLTAGWSKPYVVGAAGTGGLLNTSGGDGTATTVDGGSLLTANPGGGGAGGAVGTKGANGDGGNGTIKHMGGTGGENPGPAFGGGAGGGGAGGSTADGTNGTDSSGIGGAAGGAGGATGGGAGGAGKSNLGAGGAAGTAPGGGGGGGGADGSVGLAGAAGKIIITTWA